MGQEFPPSFSSWIYVIRKENKYLVELQRNWQRWLMEGKDGILFCFEGKSYGDGEEPCVSWRSIDLVQIKIVERRWKYSEM